MASSGRGGSKAQMSFGRIMDTISAASASANVPQNFTEKSAHGKEDEKVEKRGLLNIDLNVVPPEDDGSESPRKGGNGEQIRPAAVASEEKVISGDEHDLNLNGISDETGREKSESGNGIQAHWSKGERNGFGVPEEEEEKEEQKRRKRRWNALLEVADIASREYEENLRKKQETVQNQKRGASREIELGGGGGGGGSGSGVRKATIRKKVPSYRRQSFREERNGDGSMAAAAEEEDEDEDMVLAPPLVVRSTRSRAVAMPNKYRDSILDGGVTVAEAEFHRPNRSGKSAAAVSNKRKSR